MSNLELFDCDCGMFNGQPHKIARTADVFQHRLEPAATELFGGIVDSLEENGLKCLSVGFFHAGTKRRWVCEIRPEEGGCEHSPD